MILLKNNMDEETFEIAKENDLSLEEAEELQNFKDETGLDGDEALEVWQDL
jgi:hypothetical protein